MPDCVRNISSVTQARDIVSFQKQVFHLKKMIYQIIKKKYKVQGK